MQFIVNDAQRKVYGIAVRSSLFALRKTLSVVRSSTAARNPGSCERRKANSEERQTSQAPVDRCTRTGLLPLLPSGPGGFHRIALRGTSARHSNIASPREDLPGAGSVSVGLPVLREPAENNAK